MVIYEKRKKRLPNIDWKSLFSGGGGDSQVGADSFSILGNSE